MYRCYLLAAACTLAFLSTPVLADEPFAVTPSGATEAYFDLNVIDASDLLANQCVNLGWTMVSSSETTVVCEVPVSFGNKLLSALAGPRYATPPRQFFRFNLAGAQGFTRVQASSWQEIQTAFGQTQRTDLQSENYHNSVMGFFKVIGGIFPPNTTFPNHAAIKTDYRFVDGPDQGMMLESVEAEGPLGRAGLKSGDVIMKIAGERIKDNNDLSDGLHKAIRGPTYEVQFVRAGKKMNADVSVEYNTAAGPLPERKIAEVAAGDAQTTVIQNELSVAEELKKFAELRDTGVITEEEFQKQKRKLLAQ